MTIHGFSQKQKYNKIIQNELNQKTFIQIVMLLNKQITNRLKIRNHGKINRCEEKCKERCA